MGSEKGRPDQSQTGFSILDESDRQGVGAILEYAKLLGLTGVTTCRCSMACALPEEKLLEATENYEVAIYGGPQIPGCGANE
jgi:hypothetical protein